MNCVIPIKNPQPTPIRPPRARTTNENGGTLSKHLRKQKEREDARELRRQGYFNDSNGNWTRTRSRGLEEGVIKNVYEGEFRTNKGRNRRRKVRQDSE